MEIYTDGSYLRKTHPDLCGYAAVLVKESEFNQGKEKYIVDILYGASDDPICVGSWNAGGEVLAAINGISYAIDQGYNDITVYHDHQGVGRWADGQWKTNIELSRSYADLIRSWRELGCKIKFKHVKGHSGDTLNDAVDNAARIGIFEYTAEKNFTVLKNITISTF